MGKRFATCPKINSTKLIKSLNTSFPYLDTGSEIELFSMILYFQYLLIQIRDKTLVETSKSII